MERGRDREGKKYTNASEQLQFAGRASKRTTRQQGAWQPPEAACPTEHGTEHSAGRDTLVHTRASPKLEGDLWGPGAQRKAQPSPQTCGGAVDLPSTASPSREGACACGWEHSGHEMLEGVGWGFLQAEVHLRDSVPHHASNVSSLAYRDRQVQEQCLAIHARASRPALGKPCTPSQGSCSLPLAKVGTHLDAGSFA